MMTYIDSINNIVKSGYLNYSPAQKTNISTLIGSSVVDSVNFSQNANNLFQISQIDKLLSSTFGLPANLSDEQKQTLQRLQSSLDLLTPNSANYLKIVDIDTIYKNLGIKDANEEQIKKLTSEIGDYITQLSINQLFGTENQIFNTNTSAYPILFNQNITKDDIDSLKSLSLSLNRLLFSSTSSEVNSYLDTFNQLYQLNNPTKEELSNSANLVTQRNILLASLLLNR